MKTSIFLSLLLVFISWGCKKEQMIEFTAYETHHQTNNDEIGITPPIFNSDLIYGLATDIDGNSYKTIQIGDQTWMAENLKTTHYNDGSPIYLGTGDAAGFDDWFFLDKGAYCWFDNDSNNLWMGAIYNWTALETGKLAPEGWHVPTKSEWESLLGYLGGGFQTMLLCSGSNESGFSAGFSPMLDGWGFAAERSFWSATPSEEPHTVPYAYYFSIWDQNYPPYSNFLTRPQSFGFCVRCVKD